MGDAGTRRPPIAKIFQSACFVVTAVAGLAGAWVALFAASPIAFSSFLYLQRGQAGRPGTELPAISRSALAGLGVVYTVLAASLLLAPARLESRSPFLLPGLSGRFLGSWCAFLAVVALFAFWRNRRREAEIPLLVLVLWPVAGLLAALRSFDDLAPTVRRSGYLVVLVALAGVAAVSLALAKGPTALGSAARVPESEDQ